MDPRWQSTTHVQPATVPLSAISEALRVRLVELVLDEVAGGRWSPLRAAEELRRVGFAASAEKVKAAAACLSADGSGSDYVWLVSRLARPVGGLTTGRAA